VCEEWIPPKGTLVKAIPHTQYGPPDLLEFKEVKKIRGGVAINNLERMTFIAELAAAGKLKPSSTEVIPWSRSRKLSSMLSKGTRREMSEWSA